MRAEIVTVGTELLLGQIVDTNSSWIAEQLAMHGVHVHYQTKVGDNPARMIEVFRIAIERAGAVIVTGGLGPTQDDITRDAIAEVCGRPLVRDEAVADRIRKMFASRGRDMPESNLSQADVPDGAGVIEQRIGTAPGLIVPVAGDADRVFYAVPGVPAEMREMVERAVLPDLVVRAGSSETIRSRTVKCWGISESRLAERLAGRFAELDGSDTTTLAFLAGGGMIRVRITVRAGTAEAADALLDAEQERVVATVGEVVFGIDDDTMESVVVAALAAAGLRVACAESMTGGMAGEALTRVPGASDVFAGGVTVYSPAAKRDVLGVDGELVEKHGPVSEPVAAEMASRVRELFGSDVGISVTGSAGPTPDEGPRGLVSDVGDAFMGLDIGGDVSVTGVKHFPGTREQIRMYATTTLLDLLRRRLAATARGG